MVLIFILLLFVMGVFEWNLGNLKVGMVNVFLLEGSLVFSGIISNSDKEWFYFWSFLLLGSVLDLMSWFFLKVGLFKKVFFFIIISSMLVFVIFIWVDEVIWFCF